MSLAPTVKLNDGNVLPHIGLGTWPMKDDELESVIPKAIELGYRLFDSAVNYGNETGLADGLRASRVSRDEVVVTTKVPGRDHGYDSTLRSLDESLARMKFDYVDLLLIHWPNPNDDKYLDTWRAMVQLQEDEKAKSIGVSNFTPQHIDRLINETGVTPAVNQIQVFPGVDRADQRKYHEQLGIITESWSPLGRGATVKHFGGGAGYMEQPVFTSLAEKYDKTVGQIILRWHVQQGLVPLPKSSNPERLAQNLAVFDFELDDDDLDDITQASSLGAVVADSNTHHEY